MVDYSTLLAQIEEWVHDGEDYLNIKRKVEATTLPQSDQLKLLSRADDFIVQREHYENFRNQALAQMILGATIGLVGFMFWFFDVNTGEGTGKKSLSAIALIGGAYILKKGWDKYRLPPRPFNVMQEQKNMFDRYRTKKS